jgi:pimeloyl-ACP methyl ester carboxylesterase
VRRLPISSDPVLLQHFRGNLDNWDPALVDALAADRRVVAFDNVCVGATTGRTPNTVEAMAHAAIAFIEAMDFQRVDLLGFSDSCLWGRRRRRCIPAESSPAHQPRR